ncbi:hypothetical protein [Thermofilum pendens]|uniref:Uncharacterized protein n=1 Tax=Thermofilum pendens (strain DSM 2475 / Hrk 5) TaxID=368408 RepID=A1RYU9_THEPD|nr:hypothetical protein [Thermofilum pendens]ABL78379.1 hypothetical protein Tpen_0979 [Thermofilum pendens Hrk 5]
MMAQEISEIRKRLARLREELARLERRIAQVEFKMASSGEERIKAVEEELKEEYPGMKFDRDLLELVGILPYNPVEEDEEVVREAILKKFR